MVWKHQEVKTIFKNVFKNWLLIVKHNYLKIYNNKCLFHIFIYFSFFVIAATPFTIYNLIDLIVHLNVTYCIFKMI